MTEHNTDPGGQPHSSEQVTDQEMEQLNPADVIATVGFVQREREGLSDNFLPLFESRLAQLSEGNPDQTSEEVSAIQLDALRFALANCPDDDYNQIIDFIREAPTEQRHQQRRELLAAFLFNEVHNSLREEGEGLPILHPENEDESVVDGKSKKELKQEISELKKSLDKQWLRVADSELTDDELDEAVDAFRTFSYDENLPPNANKKRLKKEDASFVIARLLSDVEDPKKKSELRRAYTDFFESGVWQDDEGYRKAKDDLNKLVDLRQELEAGNYVASTERKWKVRHYVMVVGGFAAAAAGVISFIKYGGELGNSLDTINDSLFSGDTTTSDVLPSTTDTSGPTAPETSTSTTTPPTSDTPTPPPSDTAGNSPGNETPTPNPDNTPTNPHPETRAIESGDTITKYAQEIANSYGLDANDNAVIDKIVDPLVEKNGGEDIFAGQTIDLTEGNKAAESIVAENATPEPTRVEQLVEAGVTEEQAKQFEQLPAGAGGFQIMEMMNVDPALIDREHWDIISKGLPEAYPNDFQYVTVTDPNTGATFEEVRLSRTELSPEALKELLTRTASVGF